MALEIKTRSDAELFQEGYAKPATSFSNEDLIVLLQAAVEEQLNDVTVNLPQKVYVGEAEYMLLTPLAHIAQIQNLVIQNHEDVTEPTPFSVSSRMLAMSTRYHAIGDVVNYFQTRELAREITPQMIASTPLYHALMQARVVEDPFDAAMKDAGHVNPTSVANNYVASAMLAALGQPGTSNLIQPLSTNTAVQAMYASVLPLIGSSSEPVNATTVSGLFTLITERMKTGAGMPCQTNEAKATWMATVNDVIFAIRNMTISACTNGATHGVNAAVTNLMEALTLVLGLRAYLDAINDYSNVFPRGQLQTYAQSWALSVKQYARRMQRTWAAMATSTYGFYLRLSELLFLDGQEWLGDLIRPELAAVEDAKKIVAALRADVNSQLPSTPITQLADFAFANQKKMRNVELLLPRDWVAAYTPHLSLPADNPYLWEQRGTAHRPFLLSHDAILNGQATRDLSLPSSRAVLDRTQRTVAASWILNALSAQELTLTTVRTSLSLTAGLDEDVSAIQPIVPLSLNEGVIGRLQYQGTTDAELGFTRPTTPWSKVKYYLTETGDESREPVSLSSDLSERITGDQKRITPRWVMDQFLYQPFGRLRSYSALRVQDHESYIMWSSARQGEYPTDTIARMFLPSPVPACYTLTRNRGQKSWTFTNYLRKLQETNPDIPEEQIMTRLADWIAVYEKDAAVMESLLNACASTMFVYRQEGDALQLLEPGLPAVYGVPLQTFIAANHAEGQDLPQLARRDKMRSVIANNGTRYTFIMHQRFPGMTPILYIPYVTLAGVVHAVPVLQTFLADLFEQTRTQGLMITAQFTDDNESDAINFNPFSTNRGQDLSDACRAINNVQGCDWLWATAMAKTTMIIPHIYFDTWTQPDWTTIVGGWYGGEATAEEELATSLQTTLTQKRDNLTGSLHIKLKSNEALVMLDYSDDVQAYASADPDYSGSPVVVDQTKIDGGMTDTVASVEEPSQGPKTTTAAVLSTSRPDALGEATDHLKAAFNAQVADGEGGERVDIIEPKGGQASGHRSDPAVPQPHAGDPNTPAEEVSPISDKAKRLAHGRGAQPGVGSAESKDVTSEVATDTEGSASEKVDTAKKTKTTRPSNRRK